MKESDRGMFEQEWENAFEGAELNPSEALWSKIEVSVANNEGTNYRRSLLFFKLLAAASVSLAMSIGGWQLYDGYYNHQSQNLLTKSEVHNDNQTNSESNSIAKTNGVESGNQYASSKSLEKTNKAQTFNDIPTTSLSDETAGVNQKNEEDGNVKSQKYTPSELVTKEKEERKSYALASSENRMNNPDKLDHLGYEFDNLSTNLVEPKMVPWLSNITSRKKDMNRNLWAGLGMSAGSFNTNADGGSFASANGAFSDDILNQGGSLSNDIGQASTEPVGTAFSIGINLGAQISRKIILMSGVNYVQQTSMSNSNLVALNSSGYKAVSPGANLSSNSSYAYTSNYQVSNTYELISIPLQAGYILLDRKFNIVVLSGVSNDMFLKQKIADESGNAESVEVTSEASGYSFYSISGLLGTEFSYEIGENYSLSLQPQLRQTINSFTPDGNKPTFFEVGFKFKYMIK